MNLDFKSMAKSRARYYLKGAPVQFVQVELLRMENASDMAVTLTFKNIAPVNLTELKITFTCKGKDNTIIANEQFTYTGINVPEGELFGESEAVFVSTTPLSNVEVVINSAVFDGKIFPFEKYKPIPLPALKELSATVAKGVNMTLGINFAMYNPSSVENGWQCTCGAFNYAAGKGNVMCTECGTQKQSLLNAMHTVLQKAQTPAAPPAITGLNSSADTLTYEEQHSSISYGDTLENLNTQDVSYNGGDSLYSGIYEGSAVAASGSAVGAISPADMFTDNSPTTYVPNLPKKKPSGVSLMSKSTADAIIKFAPLITVAATAIYFAIILLIKMFGS